MKSYSIPKVDLMKGGAGVIALSCIKQWNKGSMLFNIFTSHFRNW